MSNFRIHRYLFRETTVPAGISLLVFTLVLLMGRMLRLVEMVLNKGVPIVEVLKLFAALLPSFLVITIPLAFLLGILLGFSRLSADSEIIAMKSSGISLAGMMKPVLVLAGTASLLTAVLTLVAEPAGNAAFRNQVFRIASSRADIGIKPGIFNSDFEGMVIYAGDVGDQSGILEDVFIWDERHGSIPSIILAKRGSLISDKTERVLNLRLNDGTIHRRPGDGRDSYQTIGFTRYDLSLPIGDEISSTQSRKARELNTLDLLEYRRTTSGHERRKLTAELHKRLTFPLAPLLFALVGVPLGIQSHRSGRGGGFALGLGVFLAYYLLQSFAETLVVEGNFFVTTLLWSPTLLFLAGGILLFHLTDQEKNIFRYRFFSTARNLALRFGSRKARF